MPLWITQQLLGIDFIVLVTETMHRGFQGGRRPGPCLAWASETWVVLVPVVTAEIGGIPVASGQKQSQVVFSYLILRSAPYTQKDLELGLGASHPTPQFTTRQTLPPWSPFADSGLWSQHSELSAGDLEQMTCSSGTLVSRPRNRITLHNFG